MILFFREKALEYSGSAALFRPVLRASDSPSEARAAEQPAGEPHRESARLFFVIRDEVRLHEEVEEHPCEKKVQRGKTVRFHDICI